MFIKFLGVGSAFSQKYFQSNMILLDWATDVINPDAMLFIDAGTDFRHSLKAMNLSYKDVKHIYISHLHADHVGGLEYIAFSSYFDPACEKPNLYLSRSLVNSLWENVLSGGLNSIQNKIMTLSDYFTVIPIDANSSFTWNSNVITPIQVVHIMDGFSIKPCFGLLFTTNGKKVFITSDTQFNPNQISTFYHDSDIIIQDCETSKFKSGVHAHYEELKTLQGSIKKKMLLYHYQDNVGTDISIDSAIQEGFLGFATQGESVKI